MFILSSIKSATWGEALPPQFRKYASSCTTGSAGVYIDAKTVTTSN